jgi:hypothetical protein
MRVMVISYDTDQERVYYDLIPVTIGGPWRPVDAEMLDDVKREASIRVDGLRGDYTHHIDTLTLDELQSMVSDMIVTTDTQAEEAIVALEDERRGADEVPRAR